MSVGRVRLTASLVRGMSRVPGGQSLLDAAKSNAIGRSTLSKLLVYRRPFRTLGEAESSLAGLGGSGHESKEYANLHLQLNESARPSDYAALYYMEKVLPAVRSVFDLGGNVGNLFYCYSKYLKGLEGVTWTVMDLPENVRRGRELAKERDASQLTFSESWQDASGVDLLIACGCLHYFEKPFAQMILELKQKPPYVLINRTAMSDGEPVATVQDNGFSHTACMLHNREQVIAGLKEIGYVLEDQWRAPELSLEIPGYPEHRVWSYAGMFLRRADVSLPARA
ncbi:MAG: methyltransferase, TIGR04325 family [Edaphobacter sp.]|uniref:methyltransferase, TIGR04325 family n=1 Tax=Edaphobacter sp. TaxID=1934404 RepID=UPI002382BCA1|nr:methyltransferase, TIGR04325 family [Edaphobacter sp.]MDE1177887.1 methyltransferase, TIGR04325 family [Edaphobacter sp.]